MSAPGIAVKPRNVERVRHYLDVANDYWALTKPEVNFLVVASTFAGFYVAGHGALNFTLLANTLIGTLLVASGTATLNQYIERDRDALMRRTAKRPLPAGRIAAHNAFAFGIAISVLGAVQLWIAVNGLASALAVATLASYLLIYTPLKQKNALCTFIGAFPGAVPPLIGWAAVRGSLNYEAVILFAIVFLWQFPHFLAIAWMYREDYRRAGMHMLPAADTDGRFTGFEIVATTAALVATTLAPALMHLEGSFYLVGTVVVGMLFLMEAIRLARHRTSSVARRLLHASVLYLPIIFCLMVFNKNSW
jgi:heme o synthase